MRIIYIMLNYVLFKYRYMVFFGRATKLRNFLQLNFEIYN